MTSEELGQVRFSQPRLVVVKVGSSSLRGPDGMLDHDVVSRLARQMVTVRATGTQVVAVSSGAVAAGMGMLARTSRPSSLQLLQACAAVGQTALINAYQQVLSQHGLVAAQILLTQDDFVGRRRYLNARETLTTLLTMDTIPVINENDAIAFDELAYGDNDHLAALVASMLDADLLVVLSDVDGLYDAPPSRPGAKVVDRVESIGDLDSARIGGSGSHVGSGGMRTKVESAQVVTHSGGHVVVANAARPDVIVDAVAGRAVGTHFVAERRRSDARRLWIGFALRVRGTLQVDAGAVAALTARGSSLLAVGVTEVVGDFEAGSCVAIVGPDGAPVARGLTSFSSDDLDRILGRSSDQAAMALGPAARREVVHRDQLFVLARDT